MGNFKVKIDPDKRSCDIEGCSEDLESVSTMIKQIIDANPEKDIGCVKTKFSQTRIFILSVLASIIATMFLLTFGII